MAGIVTGSTVIGIAFEGGVMLAADTLVSYGSMARFTNCERIKKINNRTAVAASGDFADYQFLTRIIEREEREEKRHGSNLTPSGLHHWITRVAYNRRSRMNPLWCEWVVGGMVKNEVTDKMEPFLGWVDKLGTAYKDNIVTTGFAVHLVLPHIRELAEHKEGLPTEQEARQLIKSGMEILYYRDARSLPKYQVVIIKEDGIHEEPITEFKGNWDIANTIKGY